MFAALQPVAARIFRLTDNRTASNRALIERIADVFETEMELANLPSLCFMARDGTVYLHTDELDDFEREIVHMTLYDIDGVNLVVDAENPVGHIAIAA